MGRFVVTGTGRGTHEVTFWYGARSSSGRTEEGALQEARDLAAKMRDTGFTIGPGQHYRTDRKNETPEVVEL